MEHFVFKLLLFGLNLLSILRDGKNYHRIIEMRGLLFWNEFNKMCFLRLWNDAGDRQSCDAGRDNQLCTITSATSWSRKLHFTSSTPLDLSILHCQTKSSDNLKPWRDFKQTVDCKLFSFGRMRTHYFYSNIRHIYILQRFTIIIFRKFWGLECPNPLDLK